MPHSLSHKYPIPTSQLCLSLHSVCVQRFYMVNIDVPAGVDAPPLDTQIHCYLATRPEVEGFRDQDRIILAWSMVTCSIHVEIIVYVGILNTWCHISGKITLRVPLRGYGGVAGEERIAGVPKFHSWGKCTMSLMNINLDWMYNASSCLCINVFIYIFILHEPLIRILGCNYMTWIL